MSNPIDRIVAGLDAREDRKANETGQPLTVSDYSELANRASLAGERYAKINTRLTNDTANKASEIEARYQEMIRASDGQVQPAGTRRAIKQALDSELADHRRAVFENSAKERHDLLREIQSLRESAALSRELFSSPVQMLTAHEIGGERRARIHNEVRHLGPATLSNLAKRAVAEKDAELAAALVSVNDSRPSDKRAFSSTEVAEAVMGDQYRKATEYMAVIEAEFTTALDLDRELQSGKKNPLATIRRGLQSADLDALRESPADEAQNDE